MENKNDKTKCFLPPTGAILIQSAFESAENSNKNNFEKLEIINNFAKKLIQNMEDLDPAIADMVNEKFWDLI